MHIAVYLIQHNTQGKFIKYESQRCIFTSILLYQIILIVFKGSYQNTFITNYDIEMENNSKSVMKIT